MTDPHITPELLAYLDGALPPEERARVEAHVARCASCAAELDRLRALRRDLGATLDAALAPVRLSREADARIRAALRRRLERPRWWWQLWQRRGLLAQATLAVLVLFYALNVAWILPASDAEMPPLAPGEAWVLGQERLAPGSAAALRVVVRGAESAVPLSGAAIAVSLRESPDVIHRVYQGRTGADGSAAVHFTVPPELSGPVELLVEAISAGSTARLVRPITIARAYKIYLASDKPAYRPGEVVRLRALALDTVDLQPVAGQALHFSLADATGRVVAADAAELSEFGVAAADVALPPVEGVYTLRAALGDTVVERVINVADYELPPFRVTLELERPFYAPGEILTGTVTAAYFYGPPVTNTRVSVRGYAGLDATTRVIGTGGELDASGHFTFDMPVKALAAPFVLEAEVVQDADGLRAGVRRVVPVSLKPIVIRAALESGDLKPGVPNRLYVMTAYPDGSPADTEVTARINGVSLPVTMLPHGLATLEWTPQPGERVTVELAAEDAAGAAGSERFTFDAERAPETLLLRAERAAYAVGDTLALEALASGDVATVYLDVVHAGQTVALLSAPVDAGRATFALDLAPALVGALELHAYALLPDDRVVEDTRLVVVDAAQQLDVAVQPDQARYRPGETASVALRTTQAGTGEPVEAALGVAVVDASVYALETLPPGFARTYFLLQEEMVARRDAVPGLSLPALLAAETDAAQDLAARAAWADAPVAAFSLRERVAFTAPEPDRAAGHALLGRLGAALALLPALAAAWTARLLATAGLLKRALRRLGWGLLAATVLSPVLIAGGVIGLLLPLLGRMAFLGALALTVSALGGVLVLGWLRRDAPTQIVAGLTAGYLLLGGMTLTLAARGVAPGGWGIALLVGSFLLMTLALALWGQGAVAMGKRWRGWLVTALALLLILLVVTLPAIPALTSGLSRALSAPGLYVGPMGWLAGCGVAAPDTAPTMEPVTEIVEVTVEVPVEVPAEIEPEPGAPPSPSEDDGLTDVPTLPPTTPTPASTMPPELGLIPAEPYPLREIFPETLYWAPNLRTDAEGHATLDIPLAGDFTAWRLTVLASTREGAIGSAEIDLVIAP